MTNAIGSNWPTIGQTVKKGAKAPNGISAKAKARARKARAKAKEAAIAANESHYKGALFTAPLWD